jgi:phosphoserine phosphatase RsbU/P
VQQHFLPLTFSPVRALDYHGVSLPADDDGGDFFDFVPLDGNKLVAAVGDVSSPGIGRAIVRSGLQTCLRNLAVRLQGDIAGAVRQLNRLLWRNLPQDFYSTLFYACVDPGARRLDYVSAAHEPALLIHRNQRRVLRLERTGTVLGLSERSTYAARTVPVQEGDTLVVFTDGIPDATDERGRVLGAQGLVEILRRYSGHPASDLAEGVIEAINRFIGDAAQKDDRTLTVVRLTAETQAAALDVRCAQTAPAA